MSEARNQRFEIDIDEIERQLRRSVEEPREPKADPLAELARIVGQNDPFQGILTNTAPARQSAAPANANHQPYESASRPADTLDAADRAILHGSASDHGHGQGVQEHDAPYPQVSSHPYDAVNDTYAPADEALEDGQHQPLRRRPSRGKLIAVMGALAVTVSAVALGLTYRKSGGLLSSGAPPVIVADKSPLKVPPENPGGVQVPNQDRQIYDRGRPDGQSKVVDGREQPIDVRAATPPVTAVAPERSPVSEALGEPRRVRTVAVNPDGTSYGQASTASTPAATSVQDMIPTGGLPAPVSVQTVAVPVRPAGAAPAEQPPAPVAAAELPSTHQPVNVLPPRRPNIGGAAPEAPTRTASLPADAAATPKPAAAKPKPADAAKPTAARTDKPEAEKPAAAAAGAKTFTVQIAVRPSEEEARAAWDQAQAKFGGSLDNRPARLTSATVGGKTVHRVRLGPMTKAEADSMCGRLKSKGSNCFVASN